MARYILLLSSVFNRSSLHILTHAPVLIKLWPLHWAVQQLNSYNLIQPNGTHTTIFVATMIATQPLWSDDHPHPHLHPHVHHHHPRWSRQLRQQCEQPKGQPCLMSTLARFTALLSWFLPDWCPLIEAIHLWFMWTLATGQVPQQHTGCFFNWYPPKKLKYGKPWLGESTLT